MACGSCGGNKAKRQQFEVTFPDGSKRNVATEIEASTMVKRKGGRYRRVRE